MKDLIDAPLLQRLRSAAPVRATAGGFSRLRQRPDALALGIHMAAILAAGFGVLCLPFILGSSVQAAASAGVAACYWLLAGMLAVSWLQNARTSLPDIPEVIQMAPAETGRLVRRAHRHIHTGTLRVLLLLLLAAVVVTVAALCRPRDSTGTFSLPLAGLVIVLLWLQLLVIGKTLTRLLGKLVVATTGLRRRVFRPLDGMLVVLASLLAAGSVLLGLIALPLCLRKYQIAREIGEFFSQVMPAAGLLLWPAQPEKVPVWQLLLTAACVPIAFPLFREIWQVLRPLQNRGEADTLEKVGAGARDHGAVLVARVQQLCHEPFSWPAGDCYCEDDEDLEEDDDHSCLGLPPSSVAATAADVACALREKITAAEGTDFVRKPASIREFFRLTPRSIAASLLIVCLGTLSGVQIGEILGWLSLFLTAMRLTPPVIDSPLFHSTWTGRNHSEAVHEWLPLSPLPVWKSGLREARLFLLAAGISMAGLCAAAWGVASLVAPLAIRWDWHRGGHVPPAGAAVGIFMFAATIGLCWRVWRVWLFADRLLLGGRYRGWWRFNKWVIWLLCIGGSLFICGASIMASLSLALGRGRTSWTDIAATCAMFLLIAELCRFLAASLMFTQWRRPTRR